MSVKLNLRNIVGKHSFHVFDQNGKKVIVECTGAEYAALAQLDAKPETKFDYRFSNNRHEYLIDGIWCPWEMSFENYKFDTMDGWLQDGDYFDNGTFYRVRLDGKEGNIEKGEIVSDSISSEGVTDMQKKSPITSFSQK